MHVCWGNYEGPHDHDIPLEKILRDRAEGKARRRSLFEAANPRHGTNGRCGATRNCRTTSTDPGLIDRLDSNYVEHPELIAQRIDSSPPSSAASG